MQGFIRRRIPIFLRRAVTMAPALVVLAIGASPSHALVLSQVFLSFGIPFALVPLVLFTRNRDLMGGLVNRRVTTAAASDHRDGHHLSQRVSARADVLRLKA